MEFELRNWQAKDAESLAKYANNEKIARNLRNVFPYPYTFSDAENYIQVCMEADENMQLCNAIVCHGQAVGSVGVFLQNDVYEKSAELGYWLGEEYWNQGIMTAAVRQICELAFEKYDIVRIYAEPFAHNTGSRKVLENAGFTLEGLMKKGVYKDGKIFDYCMYALTR